MTIDIAFGNSFIAFVKSNAFQACEKTAERERGQRAQGRKEEQILKSARKKAKVTSSESSSSRL